MDMFDSFFVPKKNNVGIPVAKDEYQTKDFDCALSQFTITEDGMIIYTPPTNPEWTGGDDGLSKFVQKVKNGEFNNSCFNLYGDDEAGKWHEFEIVVLNNRILRVKDYGELVYLNPDYPNRAFDELGWGSSTPDCQLFPRSLEHPHKLDPKHLMLDETVNLTPDDLELMYPHQMVQIPPFTLPDGSLDLMKLASKAKRFSKVGIRRNQVEPQQLKDSKVITSPSFGRKIYVEGLTGLYKDLINSESRSAGKSLLSTPALKDSSYFELGEHQRCRDRLENRRTVKFTSIPKIIGGPSTSRSYRLCDKCYNKLHVKDATLNPAGCPDCKEVGIDPKIRRDDFEGDVTYFSSSYFDRMVKLNLSYGKSITVFHRYPNMFRAGKKNHRYSQCIKQITIGLSKKNYLSATASVKVQLGDEDVKELFTGFNSLINKP